MKNILSIFKKRTDKITPADWWVLGGGIAVYVSAVFYKITASGIWFDEAFSAYITRFNFIDIAKYTAADVHPPLYYWVLKIWITFFGTSEIAFRSLSVLFGVAVIVLGFILVRRLFGKKAAWLSVLFLSISPMLIRYGQEARMYTMAAAIALAATITLVKAMGEKKGNKSWVTYGVLVSLGMWTHYFTALVWLSHWLWRAIVVRQDGNKGKKFRLAFFTKDWVRAHKWAVGLFIPWIPFMVYQLAVIQGGGFWIGPVSANSFTNFFTNVLFFLEHEQATKLYATAFVAVLASLTYFGFKLYGRMNKSQRQNYLLIIVLALAPVAILFVGSTTPLRSSFVERYLIPAAVGFSLLAGVTFALGAEKLAKYKQVAISSLLVVCMIVGIGNVYHLGNYNKNSSTKVMTREVVQSIWDKAGPGEPIIAKDPWVFYEAVFYDTKEHPVYFIDSTVDYSIGSVYMLRDREEHKIKDLNEFVSSYPKVWYLGYSNNKPLESPDKNWERIQDIDIYDQVDNKANYRATEFQTN